MNLIRKQQNPQINAQQLFIMIIIAISSALFGRYATHNHTLELNQVQVYFTPGDPCDRYIVDVINAAEHTVYVQAFAFTSEPIAQALADAHQRGVHVQVILDKSNHKIDKTQDEMRKLTALNTLRQIPDVYIDTVPGIAHNKVIIADDIVITGSYNFTHGAQHKNAENILIINSSEIANKYRHNWHKRFQKSHHIDGQRPNRKRKRSSSDDSMSKRRMFG